MMWPNVVNALVGIWFIIAPFTLGFSGNGGEMWTSIIGGVILLILAGWAVFSEEARRQTAWIQYVTGLVGIWFIIAPWVLSVATKPGELWTSLVGGIIVLVLSAWFVFGVTLKMAAKH